MTKKLEFAQICDNTYKFVHRDISCLLFLDSHHSDPCDTIFHIYDGHMTRLCYKPENYFKGVTDIISEHLGQKKKRESFVSKSAQDQIL